MQCFVPPILLRNIAQHGDADKRSWAIDTIADSERLRGVRQGSGAVAKRKPPALQQLVRSVYDCRHGRTLPGLAVREENGAAVDDVSVNEAFDGAGATHRFLSEVFGRNSLDGSGLRLEASVHYGRRYANAFWNGEQMVYGDGDGKLFGRFTASVDVIGHELAHGVTQYESALNYEGESGALNEHFSDVIGSLVKQFVRGETASKADWLLGAELFKPGVHARGVRSMRQPGSAYDDPLLGKDQQPGHMKDFVHTTEDDGGVHVNSGIPNRAFCVTALQLGGHAWEKAGRIWYVTFCNELRRTASFQQCADATLRVARELYGAESAELKAVKHGWSSVGIDGVLRAPRLSTRGAAAAVSAYRISVGEEAGIRPEAFLFGVDGE